MLKEIQLVLEVKIQQKYGNFIPHLKAKMVNGGSN